MMDLVRIGIMESYASQSSQTYVRFVAHAIREKTQDAFKVYSDLEDRWDLKEAMKAYGFMRKHKEYFEQYFITNSKVGILLDNNRIDAEWKESITADHQANAYDVGKRLYLAGYDFDYVNWEQILDPKYKIIFIPTVKDLTGDEIERINQLKTKGVQVMSIGSYPEDKKELFSKIVGTAGAVDEAKRVSNNFNLPDKMKMVSYTNGKESYIVHLFNYDYDMEGFKVKKDVKITSPFEGNYDVSYASLDYPEFADLDSNNIVVPEIRTYGMLVFKKK